MYIVRNNNKRQSHRFWRLNNLTMWLFIAVFMLIFFPMFRYVRQQLQKNKEQKSELDKDTNYLQNQNPEILKQKANKITTNGQVQAAAKSLAVDLGTKYSDTGNKFTDWLDPHGWTENDANVAKTLIYQRNNYKLLCKLYSIYTRSRSLPDDVLKLLDESELKKVRKYIKI